jgi:hypothetical protein
MLMNSKVSIPFLPSAHSILSPIYHEYTAISSSEALPQMKAVTQYLQISRQKHLRGEDWNTDKDGSEKK